MWQCKKHKERDEHSDCDGCYYVWQLNKMLELAKELVEWVKE